MGDNKSRATTLRNERRNLHNNRSLFKLAFVECGRISIYSYENLTTNLMRLPIKKETKDPRQFKFHLHHLVQLQKRNLSRSTRSPASIPILPWSLFTFIYLYTSLSSFTQGAHTSTHHIHDFRGN